MIFGGADNAKRRWFAPRAIIIVSFGVRGHKAAHRGSNNSALTYANVVSPERQPA